MNQLDRSPTANPNDNYNILHNIIETFLKYNKYKHKKTLMEIKSIYYRDDLYKKVKMLNSESQEHACLSAHLKSYNVVLKKSINIIKRQYYEACFCKFKDDIKKTWKTINEILNKTKKKKTFPDTFFDGEDQITDKLEIANKFNVFFTNIGRNLANKIKYPGNKCFKNFITNKYTSHFTISMTDKETVIKIINDMKPKSSCGIDGLSMKLLKMTKEVFTELLLIIINQTLSTGIFPDKLKIAKVTPVYKKDDQTEFTNYRPISLLPVISKIFERIICKQVYNFFIKEKLFYASQYGY